MPTTATRFSLPVLDSIHIAAPCHAEWDGMTPVDEAARVRHCASCDKRVYNLSEMTRAQATALIAEHEGRLCVRLYKRADGSVLTADCPVGLAALRKRLATGLTRALAACLAVAAMIGWARRDAFAEPVGNSKPFDALTRALGRAPPQTGARWIAGYMESPPTPPSVPAPNHGGRP